MNIILSTYDRAVVKHMKLAESRFDNEAYKLSTGKIDKADANYAAFKGAVNALDASIADISFDIKSLANEELQLNQTRLKIETATQFAERMEANAQAALNSTNATERAALLQNSKSLWNEISDILTTTTANSDAPFQASAGLTSVPVTGGANLLTNGSFEDLSAGVGSGVTPPGWTSSGVGVGLFGSATRVSDGSIALPLGGWSNTAQGWLEQDFATTAGHTYDLTFDAGAHLGGAANSGTMQIDVTSGGSTLLTDTITDNAAPKGYTSHSYSFTATGATTTLRFELISQTSATFDYDLDNVSVVETSELVASPNAGLIQGGELYGDYNPSFGWANSSSATWTSDAEIASDLATFENITQSLNSYLSVTAYEIEANVMERNLLESKIGLMEDQIDNLLDLDPTEQAATTQLAAQRTELTQNLFTYSPSNQTPLLTLIMERSSG